MTFDEIRVALEDHFRSGWSATPVDWPATTFTPPEGAWVRFTINPGNSFNHAVGNGPGVRNPGIATVQVFTPDAQGNGEAYSLADQVRTLMQNQRIGDVITEAASLTRIGSDGTWYQLNVTVPYYADDC